jgi:hypothetical protein
VTCGRSVVFSGFLFQWQPWYNWNIVESGVKHNNPNPNNIWNIQLPFSVVCNTHFFYQSMWIFDASNTMGYTVIKKIVAAKCLCLLHSSHISVYFLYIFLICYPNEYAWNYCRWIFIKIHSINKKIVVFLTICNA